MREFRAVEWTWIARRGPLAIIANELDEDARTLGLVGETVLIDDVEYRVLGVETHAVPRPHGPFGLLVERILETRSPAACAGRLAPGELHLSGPTVLGLVNDA